MGVQEDAWTAFVDQIEGDSALDALNPTIKIGFKEEIFSATNFPFVVISLFGIDNEERIAMPKKKQVDVVARISGKIKNTTTNPKTLLTSLLNLDEKIKNAIEKDLQLSTNANNVFIEESEFRQLSDDIGELTFNVSIKTVPFTMGSR